MLDDGVDLVPFILEIALPVAVRKMIPGDSRQALASGLGEDGVLISLIFDGFEVQILQFGFGNGLRRFLNEFLKTNRHLANLARLVVPPRRQLNPLATGIPSNVG